jgi:type IV pilus assembly protein PilW
LRHTGFFGRVPAGRVGVDADIGAVTGDCAGAAAAYDVGNYLVAVRSSGAGAAAGCVTDAVPDTDVLVIKHAIPRERAYAECDPGGPVAQGAFLLTNDIRGMLFDCQDGAPTITIGGDIPDGTLWEYEMTIFYVRDAAVPTLARKTLAFSGGSMQLVTEELVEGVENLHLLFGFDSDGNGEVDSYATAPDMVAGDWNDVQSLEIHLLLRAAEEDGGYTNDKTYTFPGRADFVPADNFRRMMLKTRVSLRNPKLVLRGNA